MAAVPSMNRTGRSGKPEDNFQLTSKPEKSDLMYYFV